MKRELLIHTSSRRPARHLALALIIGVCAAAGSATVSAQDTAGSVFGKAPAGDSIHAKSDAGAERTVQVRDDGRYVLRALPAGTYTVTLIENGTPVVKHPKVPVLVGRGIKVDFDCPNGSCAK